MTSSAITSSPSPTTSICFVICALKHISDCCDTRFNETRDPCLSPPGRSQGSNIPRLAGGRLGPKRPSASYQFFTAPIASWYEGARSDFLFPPHYQRHLHSVTLSRLVTAGPISHLISRSCPTIILHPTPQIITFLLPKALSLCSLPLLPYRQLLVSFSTS